MHRNSRLKKSNKMKGYADIYLLLNYSTYSVHRNSSLKKCNKTKEYADIYLLLNYSTYFGRPVLLMMGAIDARNM